MPFRLKKGVFAVRCRHPHCPFNDRFEIEENVMGWEESDVKIEGLKMARDAAVVKHDSIHGRKHVLENPEVRMVGGSIVAIGIATAPAATRAPRGVDIRRYAKGDVIMKEGADATTVCEVLDGMAFPARNRTHRYTPGDCFGWAPFLPNHGKSDVIAGQDEHLRRLLRPGAPEPQRSRDRQQAPRARHGGFAPRHWRAGPDGRTTAPGSSAGRVVKEGVPPGPDPAEIASRFPEPFEHRDDFRVELSS